MEGHQDPRSSGMERHALSPRGLGLELSEHLHGEVDSGYAGTGGGGVMVGFSKMHTGHLARHLCLLATGDHKQGNIRTKSRCIYDLCFVYLISIWIR